MIGKLIMKTEGRLTYAHIEGPNDKWFWAIVEGWKGPQEYGEMVCGFEEGCEPSEKVIEEILFNLNQALYWGTHNLEELTI